VRRQLSSRAYRHTVTVLSAGNAVGPKVTRPNNQVQITAFTGPRQGGFLVMIGPRPLVNVYARAASERTHVQPRQPGRPDPLIRATPIRPVILDAVLTTTRAGQQQAPAGHSEAGHGDPPEAPKQPALRGQTCHKRVNRPADG
jgi:hypothetical protein